MKTVALIRVVVESTEEDPEDPNDTLDDICDMINASGLVCDIPTWELSDEEEY